MRTSGDSRASLHGTIGNTPAENFSHQLTATEVIVSGAVMRNSYVRCEFGDESEDRDSQE